MHKIKEIAARVPRWCCWELDTLWLHVSPRKWVRGQLPSHCSAGHFVKSRLLNDGLRRARYCWYLRSRTLGSQQKLTVFGLIENNSLFWAIIFVNPRRKHSSSPFIESNLCLFNLNSCNRTQVSLGDFLQLLPTDDNHVLWFLIWQNGSFHQLSSSPFDSISLCSVLLKMTKMFFYIKPASLWKNINVLCCLHTNLIVI